MGFSPILYFKMVDLLVWRRKGSHYTTHHITTHYITSPLNAVQRNTRQHITTPHDTTQHNTTYHNTISTLFIIHTSKIIQKCTHNNKPIFIQISTYVYAQLEKEDTGVPLASKYQGRFFVCLFVCFCNSAELPIFSWIITHFKNIRSFSQHSGGQIGIFWKSLKSKPPTTCTGSYEPRGMYLSIWRIL